MIHTVNGLHRQDCRLLFTHRNDFLATLVFALNDHTLSNIALDVNGKFYRSVYEVFPKLHEVSKCSVT